MASRCIGEHMPLPANPFGHWGRRDLRRFLKLTQALVAIHISDELFQKFAPVDLRNMKDNQQIRWKLEDRIRSLLRAYGHFPLKGTSK